MLALEMDLDDFSASNGWLQAWQKRHSVKWAALCGEAADVPEDVVAHWATRLPDLLSQRLQRRRDRPLLPGAAEPVDGGAF